VKGETVPACIAQSVSEIEILLHAGHTVQQDDGRARRVAGGAVEAAKQFVAV